ncbi:ABC transporter ATP-binding protein [Salinicoccus halodurans]|uniref:Carnitine transport ATP-binding protein OpuCA n=1 Tax=Salinicoccus halodurans TaxID=407035 RepID=A0A0F7HNF5_9STAP|nr:ABC transporter ATP-binding protein [Salinicoccus halodurans]AKG75122.1 sugar ABC transporter ATPase [Salinicoccus halodurans]SFK66072.1 NitT/TauT family transport system ATP-binding protein [Salinicoccus halodurans]
MKVSLKKVNKSFQKGKDDTLKVLNDIDFNIEEGEFVSLAGPSGCGKSTILKLIAGLDSPTSGEVLVNGNKVKGPGTDRVVVFQEGGLFPWMTVFENVTYGLLRKKMSKKEAEEKAMDGLRMVHLINFRESYPHELSGGMKQRVAIARALVMDPDVLLMDEPFAALDEQTRLVLHRELQKIWQETGKTILFITHNIREALTLSDRVLLMSTRPGAVKKEFTVQAARPRDPSDSNIVDLERRVMEELEEEMEKVLKEEFGNDYHLEKSHVRSSDHSDMGSHI